MNTKTLTIGGGCFWCTEAIFKEVEGVLEVRSGYSGGHIKNPGYREVCSGKTGHAEVIQIIYDGDKVMLEDLLLIHMITHDPTTPNRQGADYGTQYRSIIFYENEAEKQIGQKVINQVQEINGNKIVTELKAFEDFYEAEQEHQDFYHNNPDSRYCQVVIEPKLAKFREQYKKLRKTV